jgi:pimeloyl-ACP methyl ester carboxylesterase
MSNKEIIVNNLVKININNSEQWILVRGKNVEAPLIIHIQAGPGLPMIPEANSMWKALHLEEEYLVAYWDQRGCGKSFNKRIDPKTINFVQMADDVLSCTKYLLNLYKKEKVIVIGYSVGATIALMAAVKDSSLYSNLLLVGIDIDIPTANKLMVEFAIKKAKESNNHHFYKQADDLNKTPITNAKLFQKRAKLITDLGGMKTNTTYNQIIYSTILNMIFCKEYNFSDIPRTLNGITFCQNALLPELDTLNLFEKVDRTDVPVHFIHGKKDEISPCQIACNYYEYLKADQKTFTCFDNSAHFPHYEEQAKFRSLLNEILLK